MVLLNTKFELTEKVSEKNTAGALGSGTLPVYATPAMIRLIEETASKSVMSQLEEGDSTVGTYLDVKHTSASPVGATIKCSVELIEVDRARLRFSVTVVDDAGEIGVGFHERFIIHNDKFMQRAESKLQ